MGRRCVNSKRLRAIGTRLADAAIGMAGLTGVASITIVLVAFPTAQGTTIPTYFSWVTFSQTQYSAPTFYMTQNPNNFTFSEAGLNLQYAGP